MQQKDQDVAVIEAEGRQHHVQDESAPPDEPVISHDPYAPPSSPVYDVIEPLEIPESIKRKIKSCWIAGVVVISLSMIMLILTLGPSIFERYTVIGYFALLALMVFGVYRKSRTAAILLLLLIVVDKLLVWVTEGNVSGLIVTLIICWFCSQGIIGTFQYHRLVAAHRRGDFSAVAAKENAEHSDE